MSRMYGLLQVASASLFQPGLVTESVSDLIVRPLAESRTELNNSISAASTRYETGILDGKLVDSTGIFNDANVTIITDGEGLSSLTTSFTNNHEKLVSLRKLFEQFERELVLAISVWLFSSDHENEKRVLEFLDETRDLSWVLRDAVRSSANRNLGEAPNGKTLAHSFYGLSKRFHVFREELLLAPEVWTEATVSKAKKEILGKMAERIEAPDQMSESDKWTNLGRIRKHASGLDQILDHNINLEHFPKRSQVLGVRLRQPKGSSNWDDNFAEINNGTHTYIMEADSGYIDGLFPVSADILHKKKPLHRRFVVLASKVLRDVYAKVQEAKKNAFNEKYALPPHNEESLTDGDTADVLTDGATADVTEFERLNADDSIENVSHDTEHVAMIPTNALPIRIQGENRQLASGLGVPTLPELTISPSTCRLPQGGTFIPTATFYVVKCPYEVYSVSLSFGMPAPGTVFLDEDLTIIDPEYGLEVEIPQEILPRFKKVLVCAAASVPSGASGADVFNSVFTASEHPEMTPQERSACREYTFDVFREAAGTDVLLSGLAVNMRHDGALLLPAFDPNTKKYSTTIQTGEFFIITAAAEDPAGTVSIVYPDSIESKYSSGCMPGSRPVERFKFPPYKKATKGDHFKVCVFSAGHHAEYDVTIIAENAYDLRLHSLSLQGYDLEPAFHPTHSKYAATVPKGTKTVKLSAKAMDPSTIVKMTDGSGMSKQSADSCIFEIAMPQNKHIDEGQPPIWEVGVSVEILPPGHDAAAQLMSTGLIYDVLIGVKVSTYAKLTDLNTGDTPCTMTPEFDPEVTNYECIFFWKKSKYAVLQANFDPHKCIDCVLWAPSPKVSDGGHKHLGLRFRKVHKTRWHRKMNWSKYLLYGESHVIPFMIVSQDQYTAKTYYVHVERNCPWWMRASTTRFISKTATVTAFLMSIASAGNLMALAKQIQFMDLTADIKGCPKVYADYTQSMSGFNLDLGWLMPDWLGGMGPEALAKYKHKVLGQVKVTTIYCKKLHTESKDSALAYLKRNTDIFMEYLGLQLSNPFTASADLLEDDNAVRDAGRDYARVGGSSSVLGQSDLAASDLDLLPNLKSYAPDDTKIEAFGTFLADWFPNGMTNEANTQVTPEKRTLQPRVQPYEADGALNSDDGALTSDDRTLVITDGEETDSENLPGSKISDAGIERQGGTAMLRGTEQKRARKGIIAEDISRQLAKGGLMKKVWDTFYSIEDTEEKDSTWSNPFTQIPKFLGFGKGENVRYVEINGEKIPLTVSYTKETQQEARHRRLSKGPFRHLTEVEMIKTDLGMLPKVDCTGGAAAARERALDTLHAFEEFQQMLHGVVGNLLVISAFLIVAMAFYWSYYFLVFCKRQTRLRSLEAGPLWIFILDYGLISFSKSCSGLLFSDQQLTLFGFTPSPVLVKCICFLGLLGYPFAFLIFVVYMMIYLQQTSKELVWNTALKRYTDKECREIKISVPSQIVPGFVPILSQVLAQHARGAIPVRDDEGKVMYFGKTDHLSQDEKEELEAATGPVSQASLSKEDFNIDEQIHRTFCDVMKKTNAEFKQLRVEEAEKESKKNEKEVKAKKMRQSYRLEVKKLEAEMDAEAQQKGAAVGPDWLVEVFKEEPEGFDYMVELRSDVKKEMIQKKEVCCSLDFMRDRWLPHSSKRRADTERLEDEEKFALVQWFDQAVRSERRINKYNILNILPKQGHLKPEDLDRDDFRRGVNYIENDLGQRLIYPGDQPGNKYIPGGQQAGVLFWMNEPNAGWDSWEQSEETTKRGMCYANKWQYICFDHPDKPWFADDASDGDIYEQLVPFYSQFLAWWRRRYAGRVQRVVPDDEKKEIKKWVWVQKYPYIELKMKIAYFADQHKSFCRPRSLGDLCKLDFSEALLDIANPNRWWKSDDTGDEKTRKTTKDDKRVRIVSELEETEKQLQGKHSDKEQAMLRRKKAQLLKMLNKLHYDDADFMAANAKLDSAMQDLLSYALMRFEDTYPVGEEPWWRGCDEPQKGEQKIMFDDKLFWEAIKPARLRMNPYLPARGYYTSDVFAKFPNLDVGLKRYNLMKPDGARTNVEVRVQLQHVYPIMKYIPRFKVNVPEESLEFPVRQSWRIVVGSAQEGQEFDYVVDRFSTLVSIVILAARPAGWVQASVFLFFKVIVLVNQARSDYKTIPPRKEIEEDEFGEKHDKEILREYTDPVVVRKFVNGDVFVWFMQTITLILLCFGLTEMIPGPLTALFCIIVTAGTMVTMNARSFKDEFKRMVAEAEEKVQNLQAKVTMYRFRTREFVSNLRVPFTQRYLFPQLRSKNVNLTLAAQSIDILVPEMGVIFIGEPEVDKTLPPEEQRLQGLKKELAYYTSPPKLGHKNTSVRMISRYEDDIKAGMTIAFTIDQMCLRKKVPQIAATVQVVNHVGSSFCAPRYDSFLTLFKPTNWEEEDDEDPEKIQDLLLGWHDRLYHWLVKDLGAMITDRTGTYEIMGSVDAMLAKEFAGGMSTQTYVIRLVSVEHVKTDIMEGGNQDFYAMCLTENEDVTCTFPADRMTKVVEGEYEDAKKLYERAAWHEDVNIEVTTGETNFQVAIWDQDPMGTDDFIGYTTQISLEDVKSSFGEVLEIPLCMRRETKGGKIENVPIVGAADSHKFDENEHSEDMKRATTLRLQIRSFSKKEQAKKNSSIKFVKNMVKKGPGACGMSALINLSPKELNNIATVVDVDPRPILDVNPEELDSSSEEEDEEDGLGELMNSLAGMEKLNRQRTANSQMEVEEIKDDAEMDAANYTLEERERAKMRKKVHEKHAKKKIAEEKVKIKEKKVPTQRKVGDKIVDIAEIEKAEKEKKEANTETVKRSAEKEAERKEIMKQHREQVATSPRGGRKGRIEDHAEFCAELEDGLELFARKMNAESKKVVHYVVLSEQLKPNRNWKPDAIPNHVAELVIKQYTDIEGVVIEDADRLIYPEMAGRYTKTGEYNDKIYFTHNDDELFIYWDGRDRWILSPELGANIHEAKFVGGPWAFSTDAVATPDMIDEPFSVVEPESDGFAWVIDPSLHILDEKVIEMRQNAGTMQKFIMQTTKRVAMHESENKYVEKLKNLYTKVMLILFPEKEKISRTFTKDVLVSLSTAQISFRWKDYNIEVLAPFRRFLLAAFDNYHTVWTFLTRDQYFAQTKIREALGDLLKEFREDLLDDDDDPDDKAKELMDEWVLVDKTKGFGIADVHNFIDNRPKGPNLAKFREFILDHPDYNEIHELWSYLTNDCEVQIDQFIKGIKMLIPVFNPKIKDQDEIHEYGEKLFHHFDAQGSGGVSRAELAPACGETLEDLDRSVLEYKVPLSYFSTVELNKSVHKITLRLNAKFVDKKEWKDLRFALDPDWKCLDAHDEKLEVICRKEYFAIWESVVYESEMEKRQSWIRHYDGSVLDHPYVGGIYLRDGWGEQKWANGTIFRGEFKNHMPHGEGETWSNEFVVDEEGEYPIYKGQWVGGKKHGQGILRWEQRTQEMARHNRPGMMNMLLQGQNRKGISKVYVGEFKDDLFHGKGKLYIDNSVIAKVPTLGVDKDRKKNKYVALPQIDPSQILLFEGEFKSDWQETSKFVQHQYGIEWPDSRHYDIEKIEGKEDEGGKRNPKFWKYLPVDKRNLQLAGAPPHEFGQDVYGMKNGEILHMLKGKVTYADDTIYEGELKMGRPDGQGTLIQRLERPERGGNFDELFTYSGQWQNGKKHGQGTMTDKVTKVYYEGQWENDKKHGHGKQFVPETHWEQYGYNEYIGDWVQNKRDGFGVLKLPNNTIYEGPFENNVRNGKGILITHDTERRPNITIEYDSIEEAEKDLKFCGGDGGEIYVDSIKETPKANQEEDTKSKKKNKKKEVDRATANVGDLGSLKAECAGLPLGWMIDEIDGDRKEFKSYDPDEIFSKLNITDRSFKITFAEPKKAMYRGSFVNDNIYTTTEDPAWLLLDNGALFHGMVNKDGKREGTGIMYQPHIQDTEPHLKRAWQQGKAYKCLLENKLKHTQISYEGSWKNDRPHRDGIQYFETGLYTGEFRAGKRHGKGRWETHDGKWKYYPVEGKQGNWEDDIMHGIGIIEDAEFIHENVIYKKGQCQMPFTMMGPPVSGFDNHLLFGGVMKTVQKAKFQAKGGGVGKDVRPNETTETKREVLQHAAKTKLSANEDRRGLGAFAVPDEAAVIREDTDLTLPEDDLWIVGGTGMNEFMNGAYWKLASTFGVPIFKHYRFEEKPKGSKNFVVCERYLYTNENKTKWFIGENPSVMSLPSPAVPMTAAVVDSAVDPRDIVGTWSVFDENSGTYKPYRRLNEYEIKRGVLPTDRIRIVETSGVEISTCQSPMVLDGSFLRQAQEMHGRPVYEMENGGQYLYWVTKDGEALTEHGQESGTQMLNHPLHKDVGCWCISDALGCKPGDQKDGNWAWIDSPAATPDQIEGDWQTWQNISGSENSEYRADSFLKITVMKDFLKEGFDEAPPVNEEMALALLQSRQ